MSIQVVNCTLVLEYEPNDPSSVGSLKFYVLWGGSLNIGFAVLIGSSLVVRSPTCEKVASDIQNAVSVAFIFNIIKKRLVSHLW